jgi:hypothetical protein
MERKRTFLTYLGDRSGETFHMYTNSCFVIHGQLFLMTQATGAPNQETQVLQYINQGHYVRGALIKKGSQKQHLHFKAG